MPNMPNQSLTGPNNNTTNPVQYNFNFQKLPDDGSYEAYYYRVENLLSELTRLMDNMDVMRNNIRSKN